MEWRESAFACGERRSYGAPPMKRGVTMLALVTVLFLQLPPVLHGQAQTRRPGFEQVLVLPTAASTQPKASIEGIVVAEANGQPLAGAIVTVTRHYEALAALLDDTPAVSIPPVTTDERGRFAFPAIDAGAYDMVVRMKGYVTREFGQREDGYRTALTLNAGQRLEGFKASLSRSGRITGRILNTTGEPVPGVQLDLLNGDPRELKSTVRAQSLTDGSYEVEGFVPGDYLLIAGVQTVRSAAPDKSWAGRITVPNTEPVMLDLSADNARYAIRGKVSRTGATTPPKDLRFIVSMTVAGGNKVNLTDTVVQYAPATGLFEIPNLLPGVYHINASPNVFEDDVPGACGAAHLLVSRADVSELEITLSGCL
jgi:hypothetical protein